MGSEKLNRDDAKSQMLPISGNYIMKTVLRMRTFGFVDHIDTVSLFYFVKTAEWSSLIKPYRVVGEEHQQRSEMYCIVCSHSERR